MLRALFLIFLCCGIVVDTNQPIQQSCKPWGIRLYLGDSYMNDQAQNDLRIVFNTDTACSQSFLELNGRFVDCENQNTTIVPINYTIHTHTCTLDISFTDDVYKANYTAVGLTSQKKQFRRQTIEMKVPKKNTKQEFDLLVIGDWGELDDNSRKSVDDILPFVKEVVNNPRTMGGLFMGDLAYDLCDEAINSSISCHKYKPMMITAQIITSKIVFMPVLGNHEYAPNHKLSKQLIDETYMVPYGDQSQYSFEIGDVRFQAFNPYEEIFQNDNSKLQQKVQWLRNDNKQKSNHINWVITYSHYPVHCGTYGNNSECMKNIYSQKQEKFLDYFHDSDVQIHLGAHIHQYRRSKPMNRQGEVGKYEQTVEQFGTVYHDIKTSTVYVVEGAAGNSDFIEQEGYELADYEASQVVNSGYLLISVFPGQNKISAAHYYGKNGTIADKFTIDGYKFQEWKVAVLIVVSLLFFVAVIGTLIWLARRNRDKKQISSLIVPLQQNIRLSE